MFVVGEELALISVQVDVVGVDLWSARRGELILDLDTQAPLRGTGEPPMEGSWSSPRRRRRGSQSGHHLSITSVWAVFNGRAIS
jgi:hypothetical protein